MQAQRKPVEQVIAAIQALDLEPIKFKLMDRSEEGWSREQADRVEADYKRFLMLVVKYPQQTIALSRETDKFWHGHILDTMKYAEDCEKVFGYFLHHYPYLGMRGEEDAAAHAANLAATARIYQQEFGEAPPFDAAFCGVSKPAFCGTSVKTDAAFCGVSKPAFCGTSVKTDAAFCGVSKPAFCGTSVKTDAAFCGVSKPAFCGTSVKTDAAFCGVSKVAA